MAIKSSFRKIILAIGIGLTVLSAPFLLSMIWEDIAGHRFHRRYELLELHQIYPNELKLSLIHI